MDFRAMAAIHLPYMFSVFSRENMKSNWASNIRVFVVPLGGAKLFADLSDHRYVLKTVFLLVLTMVDCMFLSEDS
jgi:hypothetical protein